MEVSGWLRVCVTGGSGYVASSLIKKLLLKGHTVHATLRTLDDESKMGILKRLPNASTNLVLFKADIYEPHQFEAAIPGCHIVFHIATPLHHTHGSQYKNMTEASVATAKKIAELCIKSGTVKRLIYTGTVMSASAMKDDGSGFKELMDETCWTSLNISYPFCNPFLQEYMKSKTVTEKELVKFGERSKASGGLEVVTLDCGLIAGGDTLNSSIAESTVVTLSQFTDKIEAFNTLRIIEELNGKIPVVHVEDVCDAHIFCMEQTSIHGRFLCATSFLSSPDIANYFRLHHPQLHQKYGNCDDVPMRKIKMDTRKLIERGFRYKYDGEMVLEEAFKCYNKNKDMFIN